MSALYKAFSGVRPVFFGLALAMIAAAAPALAQTAANPYVIEGVVVDVTAANAVKAREQALTQAQVKAFEQLAAQTLSPEDLAAYTMPDADTIMALVQDFEVTNEQLSTKRYKGTYTVRFRPALAQQYLHVQPVIAQQTAPVLGAPVTPSVTQPSLNPSDAPYQPPVRAQAPAYQAPVAGQPVLVRARFAGVQEWVRLKTSLERNRAFGLRRIVSLQPTEALVELSFNGTPAQLQQVLTGAGLSATPSQSVAVNTQSPLFDVGFGGYSRY